LAGKGKQTVDINIDVAGILTSLMIISCSSLIIPSALHFDDPTSDSTQHGSRPHILSLSRITSIVLLVFYLLYLFFQSYTHSHLFTEEEEEEEGQSHKLNAFSSSTVLVLATIGVAVCSDYLVDSVDGFVETLGVSRSFIGLIIVPIVGNAGCYVATVQWARSNKINLAVSVIVGSTLQISLFVTPFLVIVGWAIGKDMTLQFDTFETIVLTISVLVVNCLVHDGQTNYFEGLLLIGTYVLVPLHLLTLSSLTSRYHSYLIVAIAFFVHPDPVSIIGLAQAAQGVSSST
jgi:calcium/proton exchanger